jgi:hypothetical protein
MKQFKKKIAMGCIAVSIFLCACQPTPETPPVIYRGEGLPAGSIIESVPKGQSKKIDAPAHWTEEVYCTENMVKINADADIVVMDVSNTPVIELAQKPLTTDELERLVAYFAGDSNLLKKPDMTKEELKFQLEQLKARKGEYGLSYNNPGIAEAERRLEKMIEAAPDTIKKDDADVAFSISQKDLSESIWTKYDLKNKAQQTETEFRAVVETEKALQPEIFAVTYSEEAGTSSSFSYNHGTYITAEKIRSYESSIDYARGTEGTQWGRDKEITDAFERYCDELEEIANGSAGTEDEARRVAEKVLSDLGISYMSLANIEKGVALHLPSSRWDREAGEAAGAAYILTFYRNVGGLSAFNPYLAASYESLPEQVYRPPFLTEKITVVVTAEGLYAFLWENMAEEIRTVAENTKLLPFDAVKERFLEHMGYTAAWHNLEPEDDYYWRYDVYRVELRSFTVPAFGRPDHAWMIPVWVFYAADYSKYGEEDVHVSDEEIMMSALDGGFVSPE